MFFFTAKLQRFFHQFVQLFKNTPFQSLLNDSHKHATTKLFTHQFRGDQRTIVVLQTGRKMHWRLCAHRYGRQAIAARSQRHESDLLECRRQFPGHPLVQYRPLECDATVSEYAAGRCDCEWLLLLGPNANVLVDDHIYKTNKYPDPWQSRVRPSNRRRGAVHEGDHIAVGCLQYGRQSGAHHSGIVPEIHCYRTIRTEDRCYRRYAGRNWCKWKLRFIRNLSPVVHG